MSESHGLRTPRTWKGRVILFLVSVGVGYSAQWLLFWATAWAQLRPTAFTLMTLGMVFGIFSASVPAGQPWFRPRKKPER